MQNFKTAELRPPGEVDREAATVHLEMVFVSGPSWSAFARADLASHFTIIVLCGSVIPEERSIAVFTKQLRTYTY